MLLKKMEEVLNTTSYSVSTTRTTGVYRLRSPPDLHSSAAYFDVAMLTYTTTRKTGREVAKLRIY